MLINHTHGHVSMPKLHIIVVFKQTLGRGHPSDIGTHEVRGGRGTRPENSPENPPG